MSDNKNLEQRSAQQRLSDKESKWSAIVRDVVLASPPGMKAIIATRVIGASVYLAMIPLRPEWFVYAIWTLGMVICESNLARLARREFRGSKIAADDRGADKDA